MSATGKLAARPGIRTWKGSDDAVSLRRMPAWILPRELTLDELLDSPLVHLVMARDGVNAHAIRMLLSRVAERRENR